jgi:hypothetical protein
VHPLVLLVLLGLACYRLTRLAVKDAFPPIAGPRERIELATPGTRWEWAGDLVTCHWCASGWIAFGLVAGVDLLSSVSVPLPPVMWLATWAAGAMVAHLEPEK